MSIRDAFDESGLTMAEFVIGTVSLFLICATVIAGAAWICREIATANDGRISRSPFAVTFEHDGHRFVRAPGGSMLHHPDCPCHKKEK
ncbi:MAG: hypothetical protein EBR82_29160 [Caulobacteraceae bacterium]|nr:hypothetical protein [Caulobacteraceae bacterium]